MNVLDSFTPLEDLIQVIYQGVNRFVLLSKVDFDSLEPSWNVYLGLADDGRWWKGKWVEKDVNDFIGSNVSSDLLASFAENIANMVVSGELFVGNWSTGKGAEIKIVFGPSEKRPLNIALTELSSEESAKFVANEFLSLALNAQARKCKLNPPAFAEIMSTRLPSPTRAETEKKPSTSFSPVAKSITLGDPESKGKPTETSAASTAVPVHKPKSAAATAPSAKAVVPRPGSRKKARKVQQMEFGSDDD